MQKKKKDVFYANNSKNIPDLSFVGMSEVHLPTSETTGLASRLEWPAWQELSQVSTLRGKKSRQFHLYHMD